VQEALKDLRADEDMAAAMGLPTITKLDTAQDDNERFDDN
jgi:hypothetical protein